MSGLVQYTCEGCGKTAEIEEYEAHFGHHEHYESNLCLPCFNNSMSEGFQTRDSFLAEAKAEMGAAEFEELRSSLDNEYYQLVEAEVKAGRPITEGVYESLSSGQRYHFNKHYNHRGDMVLKGLS